MTDKDNSMTAELLDWLEGRLASAKAEALLAQVETDPALQKQVDWLRDFLQLSQTTLLASPPPEVRRAANAAFAAYAKTKRPSGFLHTLIATLTADNWQRPALAGVRNVSLRSEPRQLIYSSDLADVALNAHIQSGNGQIDLNGQIFLLDDSDPGDFIVQLLQDGLEYRLTACDPLGKFALTGLPAGTYELILSGDQAEIEIGPLELR